MTEAEAASMVGKVPLEAVVGAFRLKAPLGPVEPLGGSWTNEVARVGTARGLAVVKVFRGDLGPAVLHAVLDRAIGIERAVLADGRIPMAQPLEGPDGWLVELADVDGNSRLVRAHWWVDGVDCRSLAPSRRVSRAIGTALACIHAVGRDRGTTAEALPQVEVERWKVAVAQAAQVGLSCAADLRRLTPAVEAAAAAVERLRNLARPLVDSHRDVDPKNCRIGSEGDVYLFDWDYAGPIHPTVELTDAALSFAGGLHEPDRALVRVFLDAYRDAGGRIAPADDLDAAPREADLDWLLRNVETATHAAAAGGVDSDALTRAAHLVSNWIPSGTLFRRWLAAISRGSELP